MTYFSLDQDPINSRQTNYLGAESDAMAHFAECPRQQGALAQPETPVSYAIRFWQGATLPAPAPHVAPGRAITGKYAYLETRGTTTHTLTQDDTPFGPLRVEAVGVYHVDWGDGTKRDPTARRVAPGPTERSSTST